MSRICSALLLAVFILPLAVRALDYTYTTNSGTVTITKYTGSGGDIVIPETIGGLPVTEIGISAFRDKPSLTSVVIPSNVLVVEETAFAECTGLTNAVLGNSVQSIGIYAFQDCWELPEILIPASVTNIDPAAFWFCSALESIEVESGNSFYSSVNGVLIDDVNAQVYICPEGKSGFVSLHEGVTGIRYEAFVGCSGVTGAGIPSGVTNIGINAFEFSSITELYFKGNAPNNEGAFSIVATVYYLPAASGWGSEYGGLTTVPWDPQISELGAGAGGGFGFSITATNDFKVVVEACTNLMIPGWQAIETNALSGGVSIFSEPLLPARFYRLQMP